MAKQNDQSIYYLRFFLEVAALLNIGWWASTLASGWLSFFSATGAVLLVALVWGLFNVPNDPSRSGKAPIPIRGLLRLSLEILIFGIGALCIQAIAGDWFALLFIAVLVVHYIQTKKRVIWLVKQ